MVREVEDVQRYSNASARAIMPDMRYCTLASTLSLYVPEQHVHRDVAAFRPLLMICLQCGSGMKVSKL